MNLRDKLRAVGSPAGRKETEKKPDAGSGDCRRFTVYRPAEEVPGAPEVRRETL